MQKVVTVYLQSWGTEHLKTEELLEPYLADGWRLTSTTAAGGSAGIAKVGVWAIFVLKK
jgi:hypothetical protein